MAQSSTSSSSTPSTPSNSGNPSHFPIPSDSAPGLPRRRSESSTKQFEPLQSSQRSLSDPLPSNSSRHFSDSHKSISGAPDEVACQKRHSQHSAIPAPTGEERGTITKRHSHHSNMNVYTECGRHSDNWLFGGFSIIEAIKQMFEK